jgi:hypothetical protein
MVCKYESILTVLRPSGKLTSLELPNLANRFYVVRYPESHPEQAHFVSTVISTEEVYRNFFQFYVGKSSSFKRCASCRQQFANDSLSIQTDII